MNPALVNKFFLQLPFQRKLWATTFGKCWTRNMSRSTQISRDAWPCEGSLNFQFKWNCGKVVNSIEVHNYVKAKQTHKQKPFDATNWVWVQSGSKQMVLELSFFFSFFSYWTKMGPVAWRSSCKEREGRGPKDFQKSAKLGSFNIAIGRLYNALWFQIRGCSRRL